MERLQGMMGKIVEQMYSDLAKAMQELGEARVEASAGGGMVRAVATGRGEVVEIEISPQVVDPGDVQMLQDLVLAAVREAVGRAKQLQAKKVAEVTGGLSIPGLI